MRDLRAVGPWRFSPQNDRLERFCILDEYPSQGTGKREVAANIRSLGEAALIAAAPEMRDLLREISNWLVCGCIASPADMAQSFEPFSRNIETLLLKLEAQP